MVEWWKSGVVRGGVVRDGVGGMRGGGEVVAVECGVLKW